MIDVIYKRKVTLGSLLHQLFTFSSIEEHISHIILHKTQNTRIYGVKYLPDSTLYLQLHYNKLYKDEGECLIRKLLFMTIKGSV